MHSWVYSPRTLRGVILFLYTNSSLLRWPPSNAVSLRWTNLWFKSQITLDIDGSKMRPVTNGPFSSVQFSRSVVSDSLQPHELRPPALQASLSITNSRSPPKPMSIESVMPSNHLILCRPLLLLPSIFPSIRVFSNESALCIRWPKYWSFSFNISPSNEHPGLISFRMDWLDLLGVHGSLKSLLQHSNSKASFFCTQLSL